MFLFKPTRLHMTLDGYEVLIKCKKYHKEVKKPLQYWIWLEDCNCEWLLSLDKRSKYRKIEPVWVERLSCLRDRVIQMYYDNLFEKSLWHCWCLLDSSYAKWKPLFETYYQWFSTATHGYTAGCGQVVPLVYPALYPLYGAVISCVARNLRGWSGVSCM